MIDAAYLGANIAMILGVQAIERYYEEIDRVRKGSTQIDVEAIR